MFMLGWESFSYQDVEEGSRGQIAIEMEGAT
jgi:hypothetical protein